MGLSSWLHPCLKVGCACDQPPGDLTTPDCCAHKGDRRVARVCWVHLIVLHHLTGPILLRT